MKANPLLFAWLVFVVVVLARPLLYGVDPYYFVSISCGYNEAMPWESWLAQNFSWFPCDWLAFKLATIGLGSLVFLFLYWAGKEWGPDRPGHYAALFLLNPVFVQMFFNFEDDLFGLVFLAAIIFFYARLAARGEWQSFFVILGLTGIGFLVWQGIGFFGVLFLLSLPVIWFLGLIVLSFFLKSIVQSWNPSVAEHENLLMGVAAQVLFYGAALFSMPRLNWLPILVAGALAFFSLKYSLWLGIFLCFAFIELVQKKDLFAKSRQLHIFVWAIPLLFMLPVLIAPPSADNLRFSQHAVELANGGPIANDYSFGHWLIAFGGHALKTGGPPNPVYRDHAGWVVTNELLACPVLDQTDFLGRGNFFLYDCRHRLSCGD